MRHIHGLSPDSSGRTNTSGVLAGSGVDDGVNQDLEGVLASQQVDDLKAVLDNPDSQKLLSVVSAVHHQAVDETLNDGTMGLAEPLSGVPAGRVGQELGELVLGGDVVLEGHVGHLDILAAPLAEELDLGDLGNDGRWGQLLNGLLRPIFSHLDRVFSSLIEVNQAIL